MTSPRLQWLLVAFSIMPLALSACATPRAMHQTDVAPTGAPDAFVQAPQATPRPCTSYSLGPARLGPVQLYRLEPAGWREVAEKNLGSDPSQVSGSIGVSWKWDGTTFVVCHQTSGVTGTPGLVLEYTVTDTQRVHAIFSDAFAIQATPEKGAEVWVELQEEDKGQAILHNHSSHTIWYDPPCGIGPARDMSGPSLPSSTPVTTRGPTTPTPQEALLDEDWAGRKSNVTLQRRGADGSWLIVASELYFCLSTAATVRIEPGQSSELDLWAHYLGFPANLPEGTFRWEIVYYENLGRDMESPMHLFTETFEHAGD